MSRESNCTYRVYEGDYSALRSLYNSAGGENWTWRDHKYYGLPWNFTNSSSYFDRSDPCKHHWQGLYCLPTCCIDCRIFDIQLSDYNLQGYIPEAINELKFVYYISLDNNNLTHKIPPLGNLSLLQFMNVSYNSLTGPIPATINVDSMPLLNLLYLSHNKLVSLSSVSL